jgi:hypothetical protein
MTIDTMKDMSWGGGFAVAPDGHTILAGDGSDDIHFLRRIQGSPMVRR